MLFTSRWSSFWRNLMHRDRVERDLDDELRATLDLLVDEKVNAGMSTDDARRAAALQLGGIEPLKERVRDVRACGGTQVFLQDVRYALRLLRHSPGFAAVAILTLALAIGANSAIFSLVHGMLLRQLPVKASDRLVVVTDPSRGADLPAGAPNLLPFTWSSRVWEAVRQHRELFDGSFAYFYSRFNLAAGGETDIVDGFYATSGFFEVWGVTPVLGRTFADADDHRSGGAAGPVAVISHSFWRERFGASADAVGRSLTIERVPFTIIGVLPPGVPGPLPGRRFEFVLPTGTASLIAGPRFLDGGVNWLTIMVRLKPVQSLESAETALRGVQPKIREASVLPGMPSNAAKTDLRAPLELLPAARGNPLAPTRARAERPLMIMQVFVGFVLIIACANLATLTLTRAVARRREISLRLALGASRWRIVRQLFVESLILAGVGASAGVLVASWGTRILAQWFTHEPYGLVTPVVFDRDVLAFACLVTVAATVVFGVLPAHQATRINPLEWLKQHASSIVGPPRRLASLFMIAQVALSLVLTAGGALLLQSYAKLVARDLGFNPTNVLTVDVRATKTQASPAARVAMFNELPRAAAAVPGVVEAAIAGVTPLTGGFGLDDVEVAGAALPRSSGETFTNRVGPGWFRTYEMQLLRGREFTDGDHSRSRPVAIVNEAFVRQVFGNVDAVGLVIRQMRPPPGRKPSEWEIIGVVTSAAYHSMRAAAPPTMYLAFAQVDEQLLARGIGPDTASLSVRVAASSLGLTKSVAAAIAKVNPDLDLTFRPFDGIVERATTLERTLAILSGFFAVLSLLLVAVGLYGVASHTVNQRQREIGVRMALGASPGLVWREVLLRVLALVGCGIAIGVAFSLGAERLITTTLYGMESMDLFTLAGVIFILTLTGALAGCLPARRASRVDPLVTLRSE